MPSTHSLESVDDSVQSSDDSAYDSDDDIRLAEEEWEESITQLHLVLTVVAMPFIGKWFGRRWSQWAYARYLRFGFTKGFFGVSG
ncbi:hypothetical protein BS47DRAFT_1317195 [Hydnum rufescens UP504]|uniref:Uncharacterized protein n=1 Tax=Hydnum rufescens UP504 TaxID=1448309 RepID=A0A9P6AXE3_9AGAM|nr:hypothetical protein BS47DRAFT_1317195 [Hydnum rufescens UP504]